MKNLTLVENCLVWRCSDLNVLFHRRSKDLLNNKFFHLKFNIHASVFHDSEVLLFDMDHNRIRKHFP